MTKQLLNVSNVNISSGRIEDRFHEIIFMSIYHRTRFDEDCSNEMNAY